MRDNGPLGPTLRRVRGDVPAAADDIDMVGDLAQLDPEDQEYVRRLIARLARERGERGR